MESSLAKLLFRNQPVVYKSISLSNLPLEFKLQSWCLCNLADSVLSSAIIKSYEFGTTAVQVLAHFEFPYMVGNSSDRAHRL